MVRKSIIFFFCSLLLLPIAAQKDSSIVEIGYPFEFPPKFCGDLRKFVQNNILYPNTAIQDSIEGTVYVSYKVDTCGKTYEHSVDKGVREDLDKEAVRVAKKVVYNKPAYYSGKPVIFYFTIPVRFYLKEDTIRIENIQ